MMWCFIFFFFNDTATTEIYTLSLHDALPISRRHAAEVADARHRDVDEAVEELVRSEEHTSELQSQSNLVCRLLLEKKKTIKDKQRATTLERPVSSLHHLTTALTVVA